MNSEDKNQNELENLDDKLFQTDSRTNSSFRGKLLQLEKEKPADQTNETRQDNYCKNIVQKKKGEIENVEAQKNNVIDAIRTQEITPQKI